MKIQSKVLFVVGLLFIFLFLISCTKTTTTDQIVCNKPYLLVGAECCLDKNDNSICDKDEMSGSSSVSVKTKSIPVVTSEDTYTIYDLQADIGNTITVGKKDTIILEKNTEIDGVAFYTFSPFKTTRIGKYTSIGIFKVIPKTYVVVSVASAAKDQIKTDDSFFKFIKKHDDYLTSSLEKNKKELINSFLDGETFNMIINKLMDRIPEYESYQSGDEDVLIDDFRLLDTVSKKIITNDYISSIPYTVNYAFKEGINKDFKVTGLNYLQSVSVFCTPHITITIYSDHPSFVVALDEENVLTNYLKESRKKLNENAQALINMCEERYSFSYQITK